MMQAALSDEIQSSEEFGKSEQKEQMMRTRLFSRQQSFRREDDVHDVLPPHLAKKKNHRAATRQQSAQYKDNNDEMSATTEFAVVMMEHPQLLRDGRQSHDDKIRQAKESADSHRMKQQQKQQRMKQPLEQTHDDNKVGNSKKMADYLVQGDAFTYNNRATFNTEEDQPTSRKVLLRQVIREAKAGKELRAKDKQGAQSSTGTNPNTTRAVTRSRTTSSATQSRTRGRSPSDRTLIMRGSSATSLTSTHERQKIVKEDEKKKTEGQKASRASSTCSSMDSFDDSAAGSDVEFAVYLDELFQEESSCKQEEKEEIASVDKRFETLREEDEDEEESYHSNADALFAAKLEQKKIAEEDLESKYQQDIQQSDAAFAKLLQLHLYESEGKRREAEPDGDDDDDEYNEALQQQLELLEEGKKMPQVEKSENDNRVATNLQNKLKQEDTQQDEETEQFRKAEDYLMESTYSGKAWKFVNFVHEVFRTTLQNQWRSINGGIYDVSLVDPVAVDEMFPIAEKMLVVQDAFQTLGIPPNVDIGYHYSRSENLDKIQENGLLTRGERNSRNIRTKTTGDLYGDGIYTASNPYTFNGHYGDIGILVARLKGNVQEVNPKKPIRTWKPGIHSKLRVVPSNGMEQMVVLKTSYQCIPLMKFSASIVNDSAKNGNEHIRTAHYVLQELVDRFFNNGQITSIPLVSPNSVTSLPPKRSSGGTRLLDRLLGRRQKGKQKGGNNNSNNNNSNNNQSTSTQPKSQKTAKKKSKK